MLNGNFKEDYIAMANLIYRNGVLIALNKKVIESLNNEEGYESLIIDYYNHHLVPKYIVVPSYINAPLLSEILNTNVIYSLKGSKKNILELPPNIFKDRVNSIGYRVLTW